jgi:hypothetical protein
MTYVFMSCARYSLDGLCVVCIHEGSLTKDDELKHLVPHVSLILQSAMTNYSRTQRQTLIKNYSQRMYIPPQHCLSQNVLLTILRSEPLTMEISCPDQQVTLRRCV